MTNPELIDALHRLEIEQGFVAAFDVLWGFCSNQAMPIDSQTLKEEMQRWHILYGEEYEALCKAMGIDYKKYQVDW